MVGIEVHLSGNHTLNGKKFHDICDELQGKYPKEFKFTGWHPQCRCYATSILKTPEEIAEDNRRLLRGEPVSDDSVNAVRDVPPAFKQWLADNAERIASAKSLPYFLKDNPRYMQADTDPASLAKRMLNNALNTSDDTMVLRLILGTEPDEYTQMSADFLGRWLQDKAETQEKSIPIGKLNSVQNEVFGHIVKKYLEEGYDSDDLPYAVKIGEEYYIVDGNHRVVSEIIKGRKTIAASVIEFPRSVLDKLLQLAEADPDYFFDLMQGNEDAEEWYENMRQIVEPTPNADVSKMSMRGVKEIGKTELSTNQLNHIANEITSLQKIGIFPKGTSIEFRDDLDNGTLMGWSDGKLHISKLRYRTKDGAEYCIADELHRAFGKLNKGEELTFDEEYSIEALFHENVHSKARKLYKVKKGSIEEVIAEACTQLYARDRYVKIMEHFGVSAKNYDKIQTDGLGYKRECNLLRNLFTDEKGKRLIGELINIANETENGVRIIKRKLAARGFDEQQINSFIKLFR